MKTSAIIFTEDDPHRNAGALPTQFRPIAGIPVLAHTLKRFEDCAAIDEIILVVGEEYLLYASENVVNRYGCTKVRKIRMGSGSRFDAVYSGLKGLAPDTDIVLVHEAVRPLISVAKITQLTEECLTQEAIALALKADVPVKRAEQGFILASLDRERIFLMQTPQAFRTDLIKSAYEEARGSSHVFADDAAVVEAHGHKVRILEGERFNFRISSEEDFHLAKYIIENNLATGGKDV